MKLGQLGCDGPQARARLKFLLDHGLKNIVEDQSIPARPKDRDFVTDMLKTLYDNPLFEPTYGMVTYAQDLYDRYILP